MIIHEISNNNQVGTSIFPVIMMIVECQVSESIYILLVVF